MCCLHKILIEHSRGDKILVQVSVVVIKSEATEQEEEEEVKKGLRMERFGGRRDKCVISPQKT